MANDYRRTPEEEAFADLMEESRHRLSEAARTILGEAGSAAYVENLVHSYAYQPQEFEEAMEKMRIAAATLTDYDQQLLTEIARAGRAAASSIDPDDETPAGHKVCRGDVHWYYKMASSMVEEALQDVRESA